jgi:hypothetical protein
MRRVVLATNSNNDVDKLPAEITKIETLTKRKQ